MHVNKISSASNPRLKQVVRLRDKKTREETHLMIVEGEKEILRAQDAGICFQEIYLCPDYSESHPEKNILKEIPTEDTECFEITKMAFDKIAYGDRHEGILAICRQPQKELKDMKIAESPLIVVLEDVEKPGNLGAILRTCDAAGVNGVILCEEKTDIYNPNTIRASLGAVFTVFVAKSSNQEACKYLKQNNVAICSASPEAESIYDQSDLTGSLAIVFGSEQKGVSDFWMSQSHQRIKVPMQGKVDSLNVSVTAAIIIYEAVRQRRK
ncbi:MAG: RNA methyltransferase [Candidatus Omnitrophota bacterium]